MLVILGFFLGILSATLSESFFHKFFGHPNKSRVNFYFKYPKFFAVCLKPYFHHWVIHHEKTYQTHMFKQFDSKKHKEETDEWIRHNMDKKFAELIFEERYNLTLKGLIGTIPFAVPFCIGPALIYNFLGWQAFIGCLFTAYLPVLFSKVIHPLVHNPQETKNHNKFIQWFMRTKYAERILLNHYLHHNEGDTNFNLQLGGDYLLKLHRRPTDFEEQEYQQLLQDFRRLVRTGEDFCETPEMDDNTIENINNLLEIQNYIRNKNPNTEERYQFQKRIFKSQNNFLIKPWQYENFGMQLFDKDIKFENWSKRSEFELSAYKSENDYVFYRNNVFQTGDILLTNQNTDGDGLFSTLLHREINFAHAAMYVLLEKDSKKYPAVVEMNEYGIRVVPLKVLLSAEFNTYVEIFRFKGPIVEKLASEISTQTQVVLKETHAFDIYQDRSQNKFLNCARTIELIYHRSGIDIELGTSMYHHDTFDNLYVLGIHESIGKNLLMPDDFALDQRFELVGALANTNFSDMIARNLVRARFQKIWRSNYLSRNLFPKREQFYFKMINLIQKRNWQSKLLLRLSGMKPDLFPYGPTTFLSLIKYADTSMMCAVRKVERELTEHWSLYEGLSWYELRFHPNIQKALEQAAGEFQSLFISKVSEDLKTQFDYKVKAINDNEKSY